MVVRPPPRPSSASTWTVCKGYVAMVAAYPEAPDEADHEVREDGTACHWLAKEIWDNKDVKEGDLSPNNRVIDEDMIEGVTLYLDHLESRKNVVPILEQPLALDIIYPTMSGTPDAWAFDPETYTLYVDDLKYGFDFVEVWENLQLICYVWGILKLLGLVGSARPVRVVLTIIQPRSYHRDGPIRSWSVWAHDLLPHLAILQQAAREVMNMDVPVCTPNPGCYNCPARHACVALHRATMRDIEFSYEGVPLELSTAAAGSELRLVREAIKRLEARETGLTSQVEAALRKGGQSPDWDLVPDVGRTVWKEGAEAMMAQLGRYFGKPLTKPQKLITPLQSKKAGIPEALVDAYSFRPNKGVKLVKRDKYAAAKVFSQREIKKP